MATYARLSLKKKTTPKKLDKINIRQALARALFIGNPSQSYSPFSSSTFAWLNLLMAKIIV
jgi:hypothetical protein